MVRLAPWCRRLMLIGATAAATVVAQDAAAQDSAPQAAAPRDEARQPRDWNLVVQPDRNLTFASIQFIGALGLYARCRDGTYDLMVQGLPEPPPRGATRELGLSIDGPGAGDTTVWTVGEDRTVAFSRVPIRVARELARGGTLNIVVPETAGARRIRYVMELEPSSAAIEQTLTACGRSMADPRRDGTDVEGNGQDGLPRTLVWAAAPQMRFPPPVRGRSPTLGYVVLSCAVRADGGLRDCEVESEHPRDFELAATVLRATARARVRWKDQAAAAGRSLDGRLIYFTVNFTLR